MPRKKKRYLGSRSDKAMYVRYVSTYGVRLQCGEQLVYASGSYADRSNIPVKVRPSFSAMLSTTPDREPIRESRDV